MRARESTMSVALTSMQTAGMTTRAPITRLTQRSASQPPPMVPGIPPTTSRRPKMAVDLPCVRPSWFW